MTIAEDLARTIIDPKAYSEREIVDAAFTKLRANHPLDKAVVDEFEPFWVVTRHADIKEIERQPEIFRNGEKSTFITNIESNERVKMLTGGEPNLIRSLVSVDGDEHKSLRGVVFPHVTPRAIKPLEDQIRVIANEFVDHMLSFDGECDFVKDFALHYPLHVIMSIFGVPPEDEPRMLKLTQEFFGVHDPEEQRDDVIDDPVAAAKMWYASLQDFYAYFDRLSAERRRNPTDDLLSHIANATVNGRPIPRDVANGYYVAIATAGHDTTSSTTAGGMHGMIAFPGQFDLVKSSPELINPMIDEALRWSCPVKHFMRSAAQDTEVSGQSIGAMERLMLCYPSANRDEDIFDNPDVFDVRRDATNHIAFGAGPHMCLGQHLAKLEMRLLFEELMPHIESIELAGAPRLVETNFVGGYKSLPVRFRKK